MTRTRAWPPSLVNPGQVVGTSLGLASLATVAWTVVANTARSSANAARIAAAAAARATRCTRRAAQGKTAHASIFDHAPSAGFSRGFELSAGIMPPP